MHFAVLGSAGSWYVRDLQRAAEQRGHRLTRIDFASLRASVGRPPARLEPASQKPVLWLPGASPQAHACGSPLQSPPDAARSLRVPPPAVTANGLDLSEVEAVVVRTMPPGSLEQVVFRMDALGRLEAAGVPILNPPKAIECAVDKYLATVRLEQAGLPVPPTVVCENAEAALDAFARLDGDVVVKPLFGSEGRGMLRVGDPELALRAFRTLERIDAVLYVQQYVHHEGFDLRVLVLDGRVVGAVKRRSDGGFRTNVSQGAAAELYHPTGDEEAIALRAAAAVGTRLAGVDLLYDQAGACYVIEVNGVPGWRAFARATGIDVAAEIIDSLERFR